MVIPDWRKPQEGEIIAVGRGKSNDEGKVFPLAMKDGDRILFGKYSGTEDFIIMREDVGCDLWCEQERTCGLAQIAVVSG